MATVDEQLRRGYAVIFSIRINDLTNQGLRRIMGKMKLASFGRVIGAKGAAEYHPVVGVEKHLCGTASFALVGWGRVEFEDQPYITHARTHIGKLPRLQPRPFEIKRGRKIPCDFGPLLDGPRRIPEAIRFERRIECCLSDHLDDRFPV